MLDAFLRTAWRWFLGTLLAIAIVAFVALAYLAA